MDENGAPQHPKHTDTHNHYPAVKCSRERHSLPFDAPGAIPFACGTVWVIRVQKQRGCPPLLTWCGAIAADWQFQKLIVRSLSGGAVLATSTNDTKVTM